MIGRTVYFSRYAREADAGALVCENWLYMYVVVFCESEALR